VRPENKKNKRESLVTTYLQRDFDPEIKNKIKESISKEKTAFVICPTKESARDTFNTLSKDFPSATLIFPGNKTKKTIKQIEQIILSNEPLVVVSLPSIFSIPVKDLGLVLIEKENSNAYKTMRKPYFDVRRFIFHYTKAVGADLILKDFPVSVDAHEYLKETKSDSTISDVKVIDMTDEKEKTKSFVFSKSALETIKKKIKAEKNIFLFNLRKGLASEVVCHDCGKAVIQDGVNLSLHVDRKTGERYFKNVLTNKRFDTKVRCDNCDSWNFDSLGIGTETVEEEFKKMFPSTKVFRIEKEITNTEKKVKETIEKWNKSKGGILIGTEMSLPHIKNYIDETIVVSFDTLFNIPSYKINEKIISLVEQMSQKTKGSVILQTRRADTPLLKSIKGLKMQDFYKKEIFLRKALSYPPFGSIIKISGKSHRNKADKNNDFIEKVLESFNYTKNVKLLGNYIETVFTIKTKDHSFTYKENEGSKELQNLKKNLRNLPPHFEIRLNPEKLF